MKTKQLLTLAVVTAIAGTTMLGATSATSDYMHYQDGTISICDPSSNGTKCITMQDKNLGASEAGTGTSSYGYHFQRGNNHGFLPGEIDSDTFPGGESPSNSQINCSANSPSNPVNSSAFIVGYDDYCNPSNDNLRGGGNDTQENNYGFDETNNKATNVENRRGPCEDGYHVPSQGERGILLKYWAANYTGAGNTLNLSYSSGLPYFSSNVTAGGQFQEDFKIPFAGSRDNYAIIYSIGYGARLWSSSPLVGNDGARRFFLEPGTAKTTDPSYRASAFSLRCFKDSYLSFPSSEGGEPQVIVNIAEFNGGQNTCSGSNYIFENIVAGTNTGTHTLSGVFQCAFGNGRSSSTVTLQLSGNLVADGDRVISGSNLMMKNSEWTVSPVGLKFADTLISTWRALTATQTLFQKTANLIGVASGVVEVQLTVPGGTPDGTYNGTLVLTY